MTVNYVRTRSPTSLARKARTIAGSHFYLAATATVISALAVSALANRYFAKMATRDNPPLGRFLMTLAS